MFLKKMIYYPPTYPKDKEKTLKELFLFLVDKKITERKSLHFFIRQYLEKNKIKDFYPKLWHLNFIYYRYFKKAKNDDLLKLLRVVKIRSLSGIVPLSVFTSPKNSCPFACVYCALVEGAPKSYFPDEAAVVRAIRANYDPFRQTFDRLVQFYLCGHSIDKVEVIIQGGTFSFYDKEYRRWFVKRVFDGLNTDIKKIIKTGRIDFSDALDLEQAKKLNEDGPSRMVGLTIETRPDFIHEEEVLFLRKLGVTRVELGVQSTDDKILKHVNRGHTDEDVKKATRILRDAGFKITYHLMPGLPGSDFEGDIKVLKEVFEKDDFKPDNIKFFPPRWLKIALLPAGIKWENLNRLMRTILKN